MLFSLCIELTWAGNPPQVTEQQVTDPLEAEVNTLIKLADENIHQAQYEQALESLTRAYEISKTMENKETSNNVLNSIAHVYYNTGQFEQAHRFYGELVALDKASGDKDALAVSLFNLAHVEASLKKYQQAEASFEHSLQISHEIGDKSGIAYTLKAMGVNAQAQTKFAHAETYLNEALQTFESIGDNMQTAAVHRHLGDIDQKENRFKQAIMHYETALPLLADDTFSIILLRTYRGLSSAYEQIQNFKQAYINQRAYTQLLQQQLQQKNNETTQRLQVQFETQQFADANKQLELANQRQQQELQHRQELLQMQLLIIGLAISITVLVIYFWWRSRLHARHMQMLATIDELTGIMNRRAILEYGMYEWQRAKRFKRPICCLVFDIDHFKTINDTWGHATGDTVLKTLATVVKGSLRKTDAFGRIGGEEFLLIATETEAQQAEVLAERIRLEIEATTYEGISGRNITVSIGIAPMTDEKSLEELIAHADEALYTAKDQGRNRVITYQSQLFLDKHPSTN